MLQADHLTWAPNSVRVSIRTCQDNWNVIFNCQDFKAIRYSQPSEHWYECSRQSWLLWAAYLHWPVSWVPWCQAFLCTRICVIIFSRESKKLNPLSSYPVRQCRSLYDRKRLGWYSGHRNPSSLLMFAGPFHEEILLLHPTNFQYTMLLKTKKMDVNSCQQLVKKLGRN